MFSLLDGECPGQIKATRILKSKFSVVREFPGCEKTGEVTTLCSVRRPVQVSLGTVAGQLAFSSHISRVPGLVRSASSHTVISPPSKERTKYVSYEKNTEKQYR
jgi:hypothetical protein